MVRVAGIEQREAAAVTVHAIQVRLVQLFAGLTTLSRQPHLLRRGIDRDDAVGVPLSRGERALLAAVEAVHVEHAPTGLLRPPEKIATLLEVRDVLRLERGAFDGIGEQRLDGAGGHVHFDEVDGALRTIATHHAHFVTVHGPVHIHQRLVLPLGHVDLLHGLLAATEGPQFAARDVFFAGHRVLVVDQHRARLGEDVHEEQILHLALVAAHERERLAVG